MRLLWAISSVMVAFYLSVSPAIAGVGGGDYIAGGRRSLLAFIETQGNTSFRCSPSGPCIPCQYSEKNDEKYRCSETGYHLPLKCIEVQENKENNKNRRRLASLRNIEFSDSKLLATISNFKWRKLLDDSSAQSSDAGKKQYITYRSCVPVDGEEKLSVLGFEINTAKRKGLLAVIIVVGFLLILVSSIYDRYNRSNKGQFLWS